MTESNPIRWVQSWTDEAGTFRIGRAGVELVAEWVGVATLRTNRSGSHVEFETSAACDSAWASKLRAGSVPALVRHLRGEVTLHGSAVCLDEDAVVLLGASGSGKSTLAADLCHNGECILLADDTAFLVPGSGTFAVHPTEDAVWLAPDAQEVLGLNPRGPRKVPVAPPRLGSYVVPLRAVVRLTFADVPGCQLAPCRGQSAFEVLSCSLFRFVLDEPEVALGDASRLAQLASKIPIYELRRARDLRQLPACRAAVLDLLSGTARGVQGDAAHPAL
jgi:hypothetical protein